MEGGEEGVKVEAGEGEAEGVRTGQDNWGSRRNLPKCKSQEDLINHAYSLASLDFPCFLLELCFAAIPTYIVKHRSPLPLLSNS